MENSGDMRPAATSGDLAVSRDPPGRTATPRPATKTRIVLGSLAGLLLVAGALYYFADRETGAEVASQDQASERSQIATAPPPAEGTAPSPQIMSPDGALSPRSPPSAGVQPPPSSPEGSATPSAPAASPGEALTPRAVTTSRIPRPEGQSPVAANESPASQGTVPGNPSLMTDRPTALPGEEIMVVQRPRVNIRSEPGRNGRVIGTAAKGSEVKVIGRSGNWIEVETGAGRGWISGSLLGAR